MSDDSRPSRVQLDSFFAQLKADRANQLCFDCKATGSAWASISLGIYLCLDCSGRHRSLGVHISFVRSLNLDSWNWDQLRLMKVGGNSIAADYLSRDRSFSSDERDTARKYSSSIVALWRDHLSGLAASDKLICPDHALLKSVLNIGTVTPASGFASAAVDRDEFFSPSPRASGVSTPVEDYFESKNSPQMKSSLLAGGQVSARLLSSGSPMSNTNLNSNIISSLSSTSSSRQRSSRGLGAAVKKVSNISFEEAEARAKKAEEQRATLDLETELARQAVLARDADSSYAALAQKSVLSSGPLNTTGSAPSKDTKTEIYDYPAQPATTGPPQAGLERLGMGRGKWQAAGAVPSLSSNPYSTTGNTSTSVSASGSNNTKIQGSGNSISSETYFANNNDASTGPKNQGGRGNDEIEDERRRRLQQLTAQGGISSNDYFCSGGQKTNNDRGSGSGNTTNFSNLEDGAKDLARKIVTQATADFNTIKNFATETATRIQNSLSEIQRNNNSNGNSNSTNNDGLGFGSGGSNSSGNRYSGY